MKLPIPPLLYLVSLGLFGLAGCNLPPPPRPVGGSDEPPRTTAVELRPLGEIIELVSLVHDGATNGRGGDTHVIVRYKPGAEVKPPAWYIRENMSSGTVTSTAGREIMQKVWVVDDGDPRHGNRLWQTFENIKLVGVSSDAQLAWFVRDVPPPKQGEPAPEAKEEALLKVNLHFSPELLAELRSLQGRAEPAPNVGVWIDVPETRVVNGVTHISKKDEARFRSLDELLSQIHFDTYSGKSVKGLIVRSVDPDLARVLGIAAGEVLIELNGRAVRSRSEALEIVKGDYKRGVRTFTTKWLANGAVIERTWQAPDR